MASTIRSWIQQEFPAHGSNVNCLALGQQSGQVLVTGGADMKINLWAIGKPQCVMSLSGHKAPVRCVKFSNTEEQVCAGYQSGYLKLFDLEGGGVPVVTYKIHDACVKCLSFHHFNEHIVTGSDDSTIRLWDVKSRGLVYKMEAHKTGVNCVSFSPDGKWVASGYDDGVVKLWDIRVNNKLLKEFNHHRAAVNTLTFHPREFMMASGSVDGTVNFLDMEKFQLIASTDRENRAVRCMLFTTDGECLIAGFQDRLKVYDWEPVITLDTEPVSWGHIQDLATCHNQLIGASFTSNIVIISVVDLDKVQPYGDISKPLNFATTHTFKPPKDLPKTTFSKTIKEPTYVTAYPSEATVDEFGNPRPGRKMTRSPVLKLPPSSRLNGSDSDSDVPPLPTRTTVRHSPQPISKPFSDPALPQILQAASTSTYTRIKPANGTQPQTLSDDNFPSLDTGRRSSNPSPSSMESLSPDLSIHHSPSEPYLNRPLSSSTLPYLSLSHRPPEPDIPEPTLGVLVEPPIHIPPTVLAQLPNKNQRQKMTMTQVRVEKDEGIIPRMLDRPSGLPLDEFLPAPKGYTTDISEVDMLQAIMYGHQQMMTVLMNRNRNLQIVYSKWTTKDIKTAFQEALNMSDKAIIVDILDVLSVQPKIWTLELSSIVFPALPDLVQSKYETYMTCGCAVLRLILVNFGAQIKEGMMIGPRSGKSDLAAEERYHRVKKCHDSLLLLKPVITKRQTMTGTLGQSFRELSSLIANHNL